MITACEQGACQRGGAVGGDVANRVPRFIGRCDPSADRAALRETCAPRLVQSTKDPNQYRYSIGTYPVPYSFFTIINDNGAILVSLPNVATCTSKGVSYM